MKMETVRLIITQFEYWMVEDVQKQSMDRDTRHYLPAVSYTHLTLPTKA